MGVRAAPPGRRVVGGRPLGGGARAVLTGESAAGGRPALAGGPGSRDRSHQRSRIAVTPCPPAAQTEISPRPGASRSASSFARVATMRAPVAAKG